MPPSSPVIPPAWAAVACGCVAAAFACGGAGEPVAIVFTEASAPRVPSIAHSEALDPDVFWGPGAAIGDADGDGRPDIYFAGGGEGGLYLNRAHASGFRLERAAAQPEVELLPIGAAFADVDRDGDQDLTVCGHGGVRLLENDGAASFADVTATAGVAGPPSDLCLSVAWGDLDGDGWLDLAVANYGVSTVPADDAQASHLYLSRRDGGFVEVLGILDQDPLYRRAIVVAFADLDGDGRLDLYLGDDALVPFTAERDRHDLVLLHRGLDGSGALVLEEASAALGLDAPRSTMGLSVGNAARGPGWDLFITDVWAGWLFRGEPPGEPYRDVTSDSVIDLSGPAVEQWIQWGGAFVDLDGDGFEELLVGQAPIHDVMPGTDPLGPLLLVNHEGLYELVRYAFGGPMRARATPLVDLDLDGDLDVIVTPFFSSFRVMVNETSRGRALQLRLVATAGAPGAAGAVVTVDAGGVTQKRMRVAGGQPSSWSEEIVDVGLGEAERADVTVTWPSGAVSRETGVGAGERRVVVEPDWLTISDPRPPADGVAIVTVTIDVARAGLGGAGSAVTWTGGGDELQVVCDAAGVAVLSLPPRAIPQTVRGTISIDGRTVGARPAVDYR